MTPLHRGALVAGPVGKPLRTGTAHGVAVDGQRVQQHLGVKATGFGALQVPGGVADQSPMTVRLARCTLTAGTSHGHLLASPHDAIPMPRRDSEHSEVCRRR